MNRREAALLLGMAAARDRRTIGDADVRAWAEDLDDIDFADAQAALRQHFRESTEWLMPVHIRRRATEIVRERHRIERETAEAEREAIEAAQRGPVEDRSPDVTDLLGRLAAKLGPSDPTVLRRREWVERERRRQRAQRPDAQPNPHYWARNGGTPPDLTDHAEPA